MHAWQASKAAGHYTRYHSEAGQDRFLDRHIFKAKRGGVFAEIGGYDGKTGSNTLFFEEERGWTGLLAEASPSLLAQARSTRRCSCVGCALGAHAGTEQFLEVVEGYTQMSGLLRSYDPRTLEVVRQHPRHRERLSAVPVRPLHALLQEAGIGALDYISLDVEGAEHTILETFPFEQIPVGAWTVENGRGDPSVPRLMAQNGYELIAFIGVDEVYVPARSPRG